MWKERDSQKETVCSLLNVHVLSKHVGVLEQVGDFRSVFACTPDAAQNADEDQGVHRHAGTVAGLRDGPEPQALTQEHLPKGVIAPLFPLA